MADAYELYEQALKALERKRTQRGIELLRESLEADSFHKEGWIKLLEVLPDEEADEKQKAIDQILLLDPDNAYALKEQKRLAREDEFEPSAPSAAAASEKRSLEEEFVPGITRRTMRLVILSLAIFTLVVCGVTFAIISSINSRAAAEQRSQNATVTAIAQQQTQQSLDLTAQVQQQASQVAQQETATAQYTPPTPTELPPTETPQPTTVEEANRIFPRPPERISGRIVAWGGFNAADSEFLSLRLYTFGQSDFEELNQDQVLYPVASADGQRIVYIWSDSSRREEFVVSIAPGERGDDVTPLSLDWFPATNFTRPSLSPDGIFLSFIATAENGTQEVYLYDFISSTLTQITSDALSYTDVAVAPNGGRVAAIRQAPSGRDIVLFDVVPGAQPGETTPMVLTNDGDTQIETSVEFGSTGQQLVYSAHDGSEAHDIFRLSLADNNITPVVATDADEIEPHFSPDERYVVYAADTTGVYNIFLVDTIAQLTFQLTTEDRFPVYPGAWIEN